MNPKILVTGATGTIGSFVIDSLLEKGADFKALVRNNDKAKSFLSRGINTSVGDFNDSASMEAALKDVDKVFLLSVTSPEIPRLQGNVARAAARMGVKHIVKLSAHGTAPDSPIGIARFHAQAEEAIRKTGVPFTFLQPQSFMQNLIFDRETIHERGEIFSHAGDGKIAMIDARDIAVAAVAALLTEGHEGQTYELTGPEAISYYDVAETVSAVLDKPVKYVPVTSVHARSSMMEAGMPAWLVEDLVAVGLAHASGAAAEVSPDLEHLTGSKGHTIRDFIRDFKHLFEPEAK
jgi:uncharacterized protein YbjT (DUF2867 family)